MTTITYVMSEAEEALILGVLRGDQAPDCGAWNLGRSAHKAGHAFHECPYLFQSYLALCWRIGWNARALEVDG